jgi:hypothetical protein
VHAEKDTKRQKYSYTSSKIDVNLCKKTCRQTNKHEDTPINVQQAKRQKCVQADIKTYMPTKSWQTTDMEAKKIVMQADKQRHSQVGGQSCRQTD